MTYRNPLLAVDAIILDEHDRVLVIERKNTPAGFALPGGFINEGESAETACIREVAEETSLEVEIVEQLGTYSDPKRDPRKHVMSVAFVCRVTGGLLQAADDATWASWIGLEDAIHLPLVFDHSQILTDYVTSRMSFLCPKCHEVVDKIDFTVFNQKSYGELGETISFSAWHFKNNKIRECQGVLHGHMRFIRERRQESPPNAVRATG